MAIAPTTASIPAVGPTAAAALPDTAADAKATSDRFLKLLVAQMKNQDPLSPMDNAQVTSQMAQINTVSGIEKLNRTVEGLSSQFAQLQAVQGASLVGHEVVVPGNTLQISEGMGEGGFELASPADQVKVEILSPAGQVVDTMNLGAAGSGLHAFHWDASKAPQTGGYRFRVSATVGGVALPATAMIRDRVDAITTSGNSFNLELATSGSVPYSTVKAIN